MATDRRQLKAYDIAAGLKGLAEIPGPEHNPEVVKFFAEAGHSWVKDDETAWCAAAMNAWLRRAGLEGTGKLNARSFLDWAVEVDPKDARKADVVIYSRGDPKGWQGHVGFFVTRTDAHIWTLGGNQKNRIGIDPYRADRLLGVRRLEVASKVAPAPLSRIALPNWLSAFLGRK